ncbi:MAG TPA: hemagglutinin, partial [Stenotrophomonas sp.]|nr:hemagglutinin [Stenotrophomonas sp.]
MNRIYRRVWNRQLNAMVVASELATGDNAGATLHDARSAMPAPSLLALALLCVLASGTAYATESNQSLRDLQALAAKYTQTMPVKVDAEVALAARAAQANTATNADARVALQLNTGALPIVRTVLPAKVNVTLAAPAQSAQALGAQLNASVALGGSEAVTLDTGVTAALQPSAQAPLAATVQANAKANVGVGGHTVAAVDAAPRVT